MLASNFINKVLERIERLDRKSLQRFIEELARERELFDSILGSMIEGVLVLDETNAIQYTNKQAQGLLELPLHILGKNLFTELAEYYPRREIKNLLKMNKTIQGKELNIRREDSRKQIIRLSIYPFIKRESTKIAGNVLLFLDVSDHKEERQKLRRAESLASLTTLSAGVAHEIKNPLGSMDIYVQLIEGLIDQIDGGIKKEIKEYVSVISEEIDKLNSIVTDFLFTVKPVPAKLEDIDIFNLINSAYTLLKPDFEKHNVSFSIYTKQDIDKIKGNTNYLKRAFVNIFKNSIDAKSKQISVYIHEETNDLNIEIADDGNGIAQENINKIFEPYFTTQDFGSGLGLTIVYKIIKEHGGNIRLDSEHGVGTRFTIQIPLRTKDRLLLDYNAKEGIKEGTKGNIKENIKESTKGTYERDNTI